MYIIAHSCLCGFCGLCIILALHFRSTNPHRQECLCYVKSVAICDKLLKEKGIPESRDARGMLFGHPAAVWIGLR